MATLQHSSDNEDCQTSSDVHGQLCMTFQRVWLQTVVAVSYSKLVANLFHASIDGVECLQ